MSNQLHILVAVDFSESSAMALAHALKLVERTAARLHICHVAPASGLAAPVNLGMNIPTEFPEAREARVRLQKLHRDLGPTVDAELHLRMGEPVAGILGVIQELKPDMVVICSHGKGVLRRALLGSVSNQLAQRSPVPVLVVPTPGREAALFAPEPPKEMELPSVGRAVIDHESPGTSDSGIAGTGHMGVHLR